MTNRLKRFVIPVVAVALSASFAHAQVSGDDVLEQARERGREKAQQTEQTIEIRGLLARLEGRLDETQKLFADLEKRHTSLVEWMESLLDSEDGKRLALNPNAGMQFLAYQEQPVYRLSDLAPKKQTLEELTAFFADPKTSQVGYVPDASRVDQVDDMYLWARDRLARVAETEAWLKQTLAGVDLDADVVMVVGTSLQVYPAASLLQFAPHQAAVYLIDPQPQRLPGVEVMAEKAKEGVPKLVDNLIRQAV